MNRIYKVIWSKAKNCYVVASELAKNHTKGSRSRSVRVTAAQTLTAFLISAYLVGGYGVPAAMADNAGVTGANVTRSGTNASAWGNSAKAEGINTTAWGSATLAKALNSTAWGFYTKAEGQGATAWGVGYEGSTIAQEDPEYVIAKGWGLLYSIWKAVHRECSKFPCGTGRNHGCRRGRFCRNRCWGKG